MDIDNIIQEAINQNVAIKLIGKIRTELTSLKKSLNNTDIFNDSINDEVKIFVKNLSKFTENVCLVIVNCVKHNSLNEANEMVRPSVIDFNPYRLASKLYTNLQNDLSNGGLLGKFNTNYNREDNKKEINGNQKGMLKNLMFVEYPKTRKEFTTIDTKYQYIFTRAKASGLSIPRKIIDKLDEIVNTIKNA